MSKQWSPPTHTKQGVSVGYELEARKIASRLQGSKEPYSFLVASARRCLMEGTPPRDGAVIAGAKAYRLEQLRACNRRREWEGKPPIGSECAA